MSTKAPLCTDTDNDTDNDAYDDGDDDDESSQEKRLKFEFEIFQKKSLKVPLFQKLSLLKIKKKKFKKTFF